MKILEELWYGNIAPWEKGFKNCGEYSELLRLVIRHIDELRERLNDEEKEIFEKFTECNNEMHGIAEREAFIQGFTLGARIIIEVMSKDIE
jgi:hypothetical protein